MPGSPLKVAKAIEVGHIFKLGRRYSTGMGLRVLDPNGREVTPTMGSYGIGLERILTSSIEQSHDANGFWLGRSIRALRCRRHRHQYGRCRPGRYWRSRSQPNWKMRVLMYCWMTGMSARASNSKMRIWSAFLIAST